MFRFDAVIPWVRRAWIPACAGMTEAGIIVRVPDIQTFLDYLALVKQPVVYILASRRNGTLYVGVTSNLHRRVWLHRNDMIEGFTQRYRVHRLVYFERHSTMERAIAREKQIKAWKRSWKLELIEKNNPRWTDLYEVLFHTPGVTHVAE